MRYPDLIECRDKVHAEQLAAAIEKGLGEKGEWFAISGNRINPTPRVGFRMPRGLGCTLLTYPREDFGIVYSSEGRDDELRDILPNG